MKKFGAIPFVLLAFGCVCIAQNPPQSRGLEQGSGATPSSNVVPKIDPAKEADIRQLLKIMNSGELAIQTINGMEKSMKPLLTRALPDGDYRDKLVDLFYEKFHSKINSNQMVDLIVPVYDKYLSDEEIKFLVQIYETPIGQKLVTVLPKIMAESRAAGENFGQQLGRQCMLEVLTEHPDLEKAMQEAKKSTPAHQP
jgi:uncharacterized protein